MERYTLADWREKFGIRWDPPKTPCGEVLLIVNFSERQFIRRGAGTWVADENFSIDVGYATGRGPDEPRERVDTGIGRFVLVETIEDGWIAYRGARRSVRAMTDAARELRGEAPPGLR